MKQPLWKTILRGTVVSLLIAMIPLALFLVVPMTQGGYASGDVAATAIVGSLLFGVVVYGAGILTRRLQKKVGRFTGLAGLAGATALSGTALMLASPSCPLNNTGQSCTLQEASSTGLAMAMVVILVLVFFMLFVTGKDLLKWSWNTSVQLRTKGAEKAADLKGKIDEKVANKDTEQADKGSSKEKETSDAR